MSDYRVLLQQAHKNAKTSAKLKDNGNNGFKKSKEVDPAAISRLLKQKQEQQKQKKFEEHKMLEKVRNQNKKLTTTKSADNNQHHKRHEEIKRRGIDSNKNSSYRSDSQQHHNHHREQIRHKHQQPAEESQDKARKKKLKPSPSASKPITNYEQLLKFAQQQKDSGIGEGEVSEDDDSGKSRLKSNSNKRKALPNGALNSYKIAKVQRPGGSSSSEVDEQKMAKVRALSAKFKNGGPSSSNKLSSNKLKHKTNTSFSSSPKKKHRSSSTSLHRTSNIKLKPLERNKEAILDLCDGIQMPPPDPNKPPKDRTKKLLKSKPKGEIVLNAYKLSELEKRKNAAASQASTSTADVKTTSSSSKEKNGLKPSSRPPSSAPGKCTIQTKTIQTNNHSVPHNHRSPGQHYPPRTREEELHRRAMRAAMVHGRGGGGGGRVDPRLLQQRNKKNSRMLDSDEEDEYDPEMNGFIVDEDEGHSEAISREIGRMFNYDKTKFSHESEFDLQRMEASYGDIEKEERKSLRMARQEDAEAAKEEERERLLKLKRKQKKVQKSR